MSTIDKARYIRMKFEEELAERALALRARWSTHRFAGYGLDQDVRTHLRESPAFEAFQESWKPVLALLKKKLGPPKQCSFNVHSDMMGRGSEFEMQDWKLAVSFQFHTYWNGADCKLEQVDCPSRHGFKKLPKELETRLQDWQTQADRFRQLFLHLETTTRRKETLIEGLILRDLGMDVGALDTLVSDELHLSLEGR